MKMNLKNSLLLGAALAAFGCGPNEAVLNSGKATPPPANATPQSPLQFELDRMATAGYSYVYILRRGDGAQLPREDKVFVRDHTPDVNRRVAIEEYTTIIIGSNTPLPAEHINALKGRFEFEDRSAPAGNANTAR